jgi:type I restriction enzyme M protein
MERVAETARLCKMNLAVHGLAGDIRQGNSYYEELHEAVGKFDFVMANPPFNVDRVDKERLKDDTARFPFGMPRNDNANYLWIQLFYSSLNPTGRAGFVMANSAADARQSELDIRRQMVEAGAVLDKGKKDKNTVLFIDARGIFVQLDRAHREFSQAHIGLIASLVRLYRGEDLNGFTFDPATFPNFTEAQVSILHSAFRTLHYEDVPGLCRVATRAEIEAQGCGA